MTDTKPADEIRFSRVKATIWMNATEDGQAATASSFRASTARVSSGRPRTASAAMTSCSWPRSPTSHTPGSVRFDRMKAPRAPRQWTRRHSRVDRFDIRDTTALDRRPEPGRPIRPDRDPERPGHRRRYEPGRERHDITERIDAAVADVSHYRVVAWPILSKSVSGEPVCGADRPEPNEGRWPGRRTHPSGTEGGAYRVLFPTAQGARRAGAQGRSWKLDPEQRAWGSPGSKRQDMGHDVAIYRAARAEQARFEVRGATLRRVRTDAELKSEINSRSEVARFAGGQEAARREREKAAAQLRLPMQDGKVQYPDAQLEFLEKDGLTRGHVNIEVVSGNYRAADIAAKAAAGFQMHGNGSPRAPDAHQQCRSTRPVGESGQPWAGWLFF